MASRGTGKVLFTSSIVAGMPGWNQAMYNASKSFVQSFAEALHDELRGTGVTVNSLIPGPTETNFFRRAGMADMVIGRMPKDAPERVAKQGYDAMMRGDRKVLAAASRLQSHGDHRLVCPYSVKAAPNRLIVARPGSH
jgi:uncharacterized protein